MIHEDEIVFLFKILLIGYDDALKNTWNDLNINDIPESDNIVKGVKFGVKNYIIPLKEKKIGTKIFYCAFNPLSVDLNLRKSYYRGTNGVLITIKNNDEISKFKEHIFSIIEVNRDVLPVINMILTGNKEIYSKTDLFIKRELKNSAEKLSLETIDQKIRYKSVLVSQNDKMQKQSFVINQISELIKRIS